MSYRAKNKKRRRQTKKIQQAYNEKKRREKEARRNAARSQTVMSPAMVPPLSPTATPASVRVPVSTTAATAAMQKHMAALQKRRREADRLLDAFTLAGYVTAQTIRSKFPDELNDLTHQARAQDIRAATHQDEEFPKDRTLQRGIADMLGLAWASFNKEIVSATLKLKNDERAIFCGIMAARARLIAGDTLPYGTRTNIERAENVFHEWYSKYPNEKILGGLESMAYFLTLGLLRHRNMQLQIGAEPEPFLNIANLNTYLNKKLAVEDMISDQDILDLGFDDVNAFAHLVSRHMQLTKEQRNAFEVLLLIGKKDMSWKPRPGTDVSEPLDLSESEKKEAKKSRSPRARKTKSIDSEQIMQDAGMDYQISDTAEDVTQPIQDLVDMAEARAKRDEFDAVNEDYVFASQRVSLRLLNKLKSHRPLAVDRDLEDGELDTTRLTRVVADPTNCDIFYRMTAAPAMDTAITLLVDNSGSMQADKIKMAYLSARGISEVLSRCAIPHEILGYTTRGVGFRGSPKGRMDSLQHIIYKTCDEQKVSSEKLAGMLCLPLNNNADGEALLWASSRLLKRPEKRRILIVISDGLPAFSYMPINPQERIPSKHLEIVTRSLEQRTDMELAALGIQHDVSPFYRRAVTIERINDLPHALSGMMDLLLTGPAGRHDPRPFRRLQMHLNRRKSRQTEVQNAMG